MIFPSIILKIERWKWNKEYGCYVSNQGHFKDRHKRRMPVFIRSKGYLVVKTEVGLVSAHRLVMFTWRPIPNAEQLTVDHLDHNKRNNAVENLEWVSFEENQLRSKRDLIEEKIEEMDGWHSNGDLVKITPAVNCLCCKDLGKMCKFYLPKHNLWFACADDAAIWFKENVVEVKRNSQATPQNISEGIVRGYKKQGSCYGVKVKMYWKEDGKV